MAFANAFPAAVGGMVKPGEATWVQLLPTVAATPNALAALPTKDLLVSDICFQLLTFGAQQNQTLAHARPFCPLEFRRFPVGLQKSECARVSLAFSL
jgi:hypothetical protein